MALKTAEKHQPSSSLLFALHSCLDEHLLFSIYHVLVPDSSGQSLSFSYSMFVFNLAMKIQHSGLSAAGTSLLLGYILLIHTTSSLESLTGDFPSFLWLFMVENGHYHPYALFLEGQTIFQSLHLCACDRRDFSISTF